MLIDSFDTDRSVFIVAEIGNNHEGDVAVAEEMVRRAAGAGVDAVKFQTIHPEQLVGRADQARFDQLKRFELTNDQFARLADVAREGGVLFLSTPFDLDSVPFLSDIVCAFKVSSGDNTFGPLIEACARTGKPILLSCGLATMEELRRAQSSIEETWRELDIRQDMAVLHCVAGYPVPPEQANLAAIRHLKRELGCTVGYSDHTLGVDAAALSVAVGARIVEKHFTLDKNQSDFRDHQLSADPADMAGLVRRVRAIETVLGTGEKRLQPCERAGATALRRSIAIHRDLPAGACLRWEDLTWLRPGGGMAPGTEALVVGRTLTRPVTAGDIIVPDLLKERCAEAIT